MNLFLIAVGHWWYNLRHPRPPTEMTPEVIRLCRNSYNLGLRDSGEILRDIRVECGIAVGECFVIEEGLDRIRKCFK